jgi:regulator of protease activity HflC (stomatin/prohibitin superfamily)
MHYRRGRLHREGPGLSFYYFAPHSMIVSVPLASIDVPFAFHEVTADFQEAAIQGLLTYRITDPRRTAAVLDFSLAPDGTYHTEDYKRLGERLVYAVQMLTRAFALRLQLRELLTSADRLAATLLPELRASTEVELLGVEILGLVIQHVRATPEMAKALQAEARERLLLEADQAVYARRNTAVELERTIRENELDTEIAIEQKQRQVRETQMEAELAVEQRRRQLREAQMAADVALEVQRRELVERRAENERQEADARAYGLRAVLEPIQGVDWRVLLAAAGTADSKTLISLAFQELAQNAAKIGELNVSPELLNTLLRTREKEK